MPEHPHMTAAMLYAARGWAVFPCHTPRNGACSCRRPACESAGKHPRTLHGVKDASTDISQVRRWWSMWPEANVAIATGNGSGLVVLDIDPRHGGDVTIKDLEQRYGPLPVTPESLTGGGGRHLFFAWPGRAVHNQAARLGPGLDVRGDGGYVIVPPSLHVSGRAYAWNVCQQPAETPIAPLPGWLLRPSALPAAPVCLEGVELTLPEGSRNQTLFQMARWMRRGGISRAAILAALQVENAVRCRPPLSVQEVAGILRSALALRLEGVDYATR